ncbi:MAG TPA: vWA domain-containing protein, partial [Thermoplasmata archaeon]|nr:vWA domain-containing protein [Thermoplasmata archaeon]
EVTSERVHVVLAFDRSGSMAEGEKLPAAKKALLALYVAVRKRHPDATIDVLAFDNRVDLLDLVELWECKPGAFTNTGEALRTAFLLLRSSRASRREVYLVTDGLPEAYTDEDGDVRSGNLPAAMESALLHARELATVRPLKFSLVLIRSEHPEYETAAREIARTLEGTMVVTDPNRLGVELLVRWIGRTETVRQPAASAAPTAPAPAAPAATRKPGARRRKSDRRMGG